MYACLTVGKKDERRYDENLISNMSCIVDLHNGLRFHASGHLSFGSSWCDALPRAKSKIVNGKQEKAVRLELSAEG